MHELKLRLHDKRCRLQRAVNIWNDPALSFPSTVPQLAAEACLACCPHRRCTWGALRMLCPQWVPSWVRMGRRRLAGQCTCLSTSSGSMEAWMRCACTILCNLMCFDCVHCHRLATRANPKSMQGNTMRNHCKQQNQHIQSSAATLVQVHKCRVSTCRWWKGFSC